ncbi:hypothetical protein [Chryseobacterium geocarposphaerae]|uniref:DUF5050 domain-containing protein n=1 Tax=Chryseobacterium geocarposphaerae TaxID=1416776 RepID=A0A2M9CA18_9FLAO|nr:hypothetical protein [Chryseobacterium geocarposphaerae]PJJ67693.1 hypothetical protein CLV73_1712 [Chryseobacterium geocarposphaerae]
MNIRKILPLALVSTFLFNIACSSDDEIIETQPKGAYQEGIFISNEGGFTTPTAEVSFTSNDLSTVGNKIYSANNNGEVLGNVLQTIGFNGDYAYLVSNVPNKIDIVNRYTFKKQATVTSNLDGARYIAFSGNQYYVTNNNFSNSIKLNVYSTDNNSFVKSISFSRAAEKVVEANGNIVVQTDGITYDANYNELPTGYTVTIVKPSTNTVDKTVTLPSNGIIRDLVSYNGDAYALASDNTNSYIYKINSASGAFTTTTLTGIPKVQRLKIESNKFYFVNSTNKIYSMDINSTTAPTAPLLTAPGYLYGFNVIDGRIYTSDASFTADSKVYVYSASNGSLIKSFNTGIGTNGFYKN